MLYEYLHEFRLVLTSNLSVLASAIASQYRPEYSMLELKMQSNRVQANWQTEINLQHYLYLNLEAIRLSAPFDD